MQWIKPVGKHLRLVVNIFYLGEIMFKKGDKARHKLSSEMFLLTSEVNEDGFVLAKSARYDSTVGINVSILEEIGYQEKSSLEIDYDLVQLKIDEAVSLIKEAVSLAGDPLFDYYGENHKDEDGDPLVDLDGVREAIDAIGWSSSSLTC